MRKITIISVALLLTLSLTGALYIWRASIKNSGEVSKNDQLLQAITGAFPELLYDDEPVIKITSTSEPQRGWFVTNIQSTDSGEDSAAVKIILHKDKSQLRVVTGPDVYFPENKMLALGLPDSVILELQEL